MLRKIIFILLFAALISAGIFLIFRESPEEQITQYLSVQIEANAPEAGVENVAEKIYQHMTFEVLETSKTDCVISITSPDIRTLFFSVFNPQDYQSPSNMADYDHQVDLLLDELESRLTSNNFEKVTVEVTVPLDENGNPQITTEFVDAMYGGLLTLQQELITEYMEVRAND